MTQIQKQKSKKNQKDDRKAKGTKKCEWKYFERNVRSDRPNGKIPSFLRGQTNSAFGSKAAQLVSIRFYWQKAFGPPGIFEIKKKIFPERFAGTHETETK